MPDRDATGWLSTLRGEESMKAQHLRREAQQARQKAADLDAQAERHEEQGAWFGEAVDALGDAEIGH